MLRSIVAAVAVAATPFTVSASTSVAWDTLTGTSFNTSVFPTVGDVGSFLASNALVFTAGASGTVSSVTLPIAASFGTPVLSFALFADGGAAPGSALGTAVQVTTSAPGSNPDIAILTGWGGAALVSGTDYWLVASGNPGAAGFWLAGNPDQAGERYFSLDGGAFWIGLATPVPLARVEVEVGPAPVPLPAGLPLLAGGLVVLCAVRRRA